MPHHCKNFHIEFGATSIGEEYYLRQPGTDQDKHIRYGKIEQVSEARTEQRHIMNVGKRVGHSIS